MVALVSCCPCAVLRLGARKNWGQAGRQQEAQGRQPSGGAAQGATVGFACAVGRRGNLGPVSPAAAWRTGVRRVSVRQLPRSRATGPTFFPSGRCPSAAPPPLPPPDSTPVIIGPLLVPSGNALAILTVMRPALMCSGSLTCRRNRLGTEGEVWKGQTASQQGCFCRIWEMQRAAGHVACRLWGWATSCTCVRHISSPLCCWGGEGLTGERT
jgi:hypothetical protein